MATPAEQLAAKQRRQGRIRATIRWFDRQVARNIEIGMGSRVKLALQILRDQIVVNISDPVVKFRSASGRIRVDPQSRSKPGEFPKADTTRLMKDVFWQMDGRESGIVGITLDYGVILETRRDRSFLLRTLNQMRGEIRRILTTNRGGRLPGQQ